MGERVLLLDSPRLALVVRCRWREHPRRPVSVQQQGNGQYLELDLRTELVLFRLRGHSRLKKGVEFCCAPQLANLPKMTSRSWMTSCFCMQQL